MEDENAPALNGEALNELSRAIFKLATVVERNSRGIDQLRNGDRARAIGAVELAFRQLRRHWEELTLWERMELALPFDPSYIKRQMGL